MIRRAFCIIAAALTLGLAAHASAETRPIPDEGLSLEDVAAWLKDQGFEAAITKDELQHEIVSTSLDGVKFSVYMFDCKEGRCGSIQFAAGWPKKVSADRLLEWDRTKRWARAYPDAVGGMWVEMDVDLTPGGSYELLNDNLATWKNMLKLAKDFFELEGVNNQRY